MRRGGRLYAGLPSTNFSREVLAREPLNLAVLPVGGVTWADLGDPHRVRLVEREAARQFDPQVA